MQEECVELSSYPFPATLRLLLQLLVQTCLAHTSSPVQRSWVMPPAHWRRLMNPQIPVSIEHPPQYVLSTDKIIDAPAVATRGDDITSDLVAEFAERESEVLGPEDLALILKVLDLGPRSCYSLDKDAALALGQHVGPEALLRVRATERDSERPFSSRYVNRQVGKADDAKTIRFKMLRSTTRFRLGFSVNVTDLATGVTPRSSDCGAAGLDQIRPPVLIAAGPSFDSAGSRAAAKEPASK